MRGIEFRVWDILNKRFHYWGFVYFTFRPIPCLFGLNYCENNSEQYTGLKDKNGVKIFEGDRFLINSVVFYVEWHEDNCRYVLTNGNGYDTKNCIDLTCDTVYKKEIIGNIHEEGK